MMKGNVCMIDRLVRVILGLGLLSMPIYLVDKPWAWVGLIGLVPLASGLVGYCPMYALCGCRMCFKGNCDDKDDKIGHCCGDMKDKKKG